MLCMQLRNSNWYGVACRTFGGSRELESFGTFQFGNLIALVIVSLRQCIKILKTLLPSTRLLHNEHASMKLLWPSS